MDEPYFETQILPWKTGRCELRVYQIRRLKGLKKEECLIQEAGDEKGHEQVDFRIECRTNL
jgi:hypothetical protein